MRAKRRVVAAAVAASAMFMPPSFAEHRANASAPFWCALERWAYCIIDFGGEFTLRSDDPYNIEISFRSDPFSPVTKVTEPRTCWGRPADQSPVDVEFRRVERAGVAWIEAEVPLRSDGTCTLIISRLIEAVTAVPETERFYPEILVCRGQHRATRLFTNREIDPEFTRLGRACTLRY